MGVQYVYKPVLPCVTDSEMDSVPTYLLFRADAGLGLPSWSSPCPRPMKKVSGDQSEMPTMGLKILLCKVPLSSVPIIMSIAVQMV
jgi:hypothetical protein